MHKGGTDRTESLVFGMTDNDTIIRPDTAGRPPDRPYEILSTGSPPTHGSGLAMSRQEPFQTTMDPLQVNTISTSSTAAVFTAALHCSKTT